MTASNMAKAFIARYNKNKEKTIKLEAENLAATTFLRTEIAVLSTEEKEDFLDTLSFEFPEDEKEREEPLNLDFKKQTMFEAVREHERGFSQKIKEENYPEFIKYFHRTLKEIIKKER